MVPLVFLIEDDAATSTLLRRLLAENNCSVRTLPPSADVVISAGEQRPPALFLIGGAVEDALTLWHRPPKLASCANAGRPYVRPGFGGGPPARL